METTNSTQTVTPSPGLNLFDKLFILLLILSLVGVAWVGRHSFKEGLKTETAKRNGEAWLASLKDMHEERLKPEGKNGPCFKETEDGQPVHNWQACFAHMQTLPALAELTNPYSGDKLTAIEACVAGDLNTSGSLVFKRVDSNPPGSATPTNVVNLTPDTTLDVASVIQVKVCDRGGYPISIGEIEL